MRSPRSVARRGCRIVIGLEGARIRTEVEAALTFGELEAAGARDRGEDPGWAWLRHRYAVSYRMSPVFRDGAFVDTMEVAASWERLLDLYHSVRARDRPPRGRDGALLPRVSRRLLDLLHVRGPRGRYRRRRAPVRRDLARRARSDDARRRNDQPSSRRRLAQGAVHGGRASRGDGDLRGARSSRSIPTASSIRARWACEVAPK